MHAHAQIHFHYISFTIGDDELRVGGEKLFESVGIRGNNNNNNNNHNRNYNNNNNNNRVQHYTLREQGPRRAREQVDKSQWQTPPSWQEHSHKEFSL